MLWPLGNGTCGRWGEGARVYGGGRGDPACRAATAPGMLSPQKPAQMSALGSLRAIRTTRSFLLYFQFNLN